MVSHRFHLMKVSRGTHVKITKNLNTSNLAKFELSHMTLMMTVAT